MRVRGAGCSARASGPLSEEDTPGSPRRTREPHSESSPSIVIVPGIPVGHRHAHERRRPGRGRRRGAHRGGRRRRRFRPRALRLRRGPAVCGDAREGWDNGTGRIPTTGRRTSRCCASAAAQSPGTGPVPREDREHRLAHLRELGQVRHLGELAGIARRGENRAKHDHHVAPSRGARAALNELGVEPVDQLEGDLRSSVFLSTAAFIPRWAAAFARDTHCTGVAPLCLASPCSAIMADASPSSFSEGEPVPRRARWSEAGVDVSAGTRTRLSRGSSRGRAAQCQRVHRWISADALREDLGALRPGMVVVWARGEPGSWQGHVGVVSHVERQPLLVDRRQRGGEPPRQQPAFST